MNWEITIPIIVALLSSGLSYLGAVKKAKLDMEKEMEIERLKHKQELEKIEKELEIKSKTKENDAIIELTKAVFEKPGMFEDIMKMSDKVQKHKR